MKTSELQRGRAAAVAWGWVAAVGATHQDGVLFVPEATNGAGVALIEGTVVVLNDAGEIETTATAQDPRPKGIVLDDIDDGEAGPVAFYGPVDLVSVVASVTAGQYGETSTTAGSAQATGSPTDGSFLVFTSSGTTPSAFLFGSSGTPFDSAAFLDTLYGLFLTAGTGERHVPSTITAGSAETLDLETANTFDVTLTEACTVTLSNPPPSGVEGRWTIIKRGDFDLDLPANVFWRAADGSQTTTAPPMSAFDTIDLRTLDGGLSYGASLENGSSGTSGSATRWELAVIPGSPPDSLYADGDWLYIEVPV